jgi:cytochrome P450
MRSGAGQAGLHGRPSVFQAGEANARALGDALGEHSLLTLDQDRHLSHRKLLLPPSHGESVRRYVDVLAAEAEVERWPLGRPFASGRARRSARCPART